MLLKAFHWFVFFVAAIIFNIRALSSRKGFFELTHWDTNIRIKLYVNTLMQVGILIIDYSLSENYMNIENLKIVRRWKQWV
ncbi:hypothetical protein BCR23_09985 [Enterococcus quebecensis]|uniref:Uncharacterized protein n=1 Tax=Enterococcus quebecensis TaxID=903983 RepID=A0A1E5GR06_9ENTE|nr:hypothetical protein BCR23_09985 [Enterococcus quebecensis]